MDDRPIRDAVLLHLAALAEGGAAGPGDGPATLARSLPGIWAALGIPGAATGDRAAVVSALRELHADGDLRRWTGPVAGLRGEHAAYALTKAGSARARELRDRIAEERVTLLADDGRESNDNRETSDSRETIRLGELGDRVDPAPGPVVGRPDPGASPGEMVGTDGTGGLDSGDPDPGPPTVAVDPLAWGVANMADGEVSAGPRRAGDAFVDREAERGRLEAVVDAAAAGRARTVLVGGGTGVGKSALLGELVDLARDRGFAAGVATVAEGDPPYGPVERACSAVAGADAVERALDRHAGRTVTEPADLRSRRGALAGSLADVLRDAAGDRPALVGIDDLAVATEPTLALFGALADRLDDVPVVLAGAYDEERLDAEGPVAGELAAVGADTRFALEPLDGRGVTDLVGRVLATEDPPTAVVERVADHSGGNPLVAEGFARALVETGAVDPRRAGPPKPAGVDATDVDEEKDEDDRIPEGIQALIEARIDDLPDGAREVLETTAAAGGAVGTDRLAAALDAPATEVREWIDLIVGMGLLAYPPGDGEGRVRVAAGPVAVAATAGLAADREREVHRRIAGATDRASTAARHHEAAGEASLALDRYLAAADRARERYAHEDAARYLETASDLAREVGDDGALMAALSALGEVRAALGEFDEALRHHAYVRERADGPDRVRAYRRASEVHHAKGDFDAAADLAERGLETVEDTQGDPGRANESVATGRPDEAEEIDPLDAERIRLLIRKGASSLERDDPEGAAEAFETALERLDELEAESGGEAEDPGPSDERGDPGLVAELRGEALNRLGTATLYLGDATGAVDALVAAAEVYPPGHPGRAMPRVNEGIVHRQLGDPETAIERFEAALEALAGAGDPATRAEALQELGRTREALGETAAAAEAYAEALSVAERVDAHLTVASVAAELGAARQSLGEFDAARDHLDRAIAVAEEVGDDATLATAHNARSQLAAQSGDPGAAREHAEAALSAARETGDPASEAYALAQVGERAREDGDVERAVECHEEAAETAGGVGVGTVAVVALVGLARDHLAAGDPERARRTAEAAAERIEDPRASPSLWVAVERIRADCARERDEFDAAADTLADAEAALDDDQLPLRAQLLVDRAELAAERGDDELARELAREGGHIARQVGIDPVRERAEGVLSGDD